MHQGLIWSQLKMTKFQTQTAGGEVQWGLLEGPVEAAQTWENASLSSVPEDTGKAQTHRQAASHEYGLSVYPGCNPQATMDE